jgi:hypothetical protein
MLTGVIAEQFFGFKSGDGAADGCAAAANATGTAGLDEGLLLLCLPILVYT